MIGTGKHHLMI